MGAKRFKIKLGVAVAVAAVLGVLLANVAGAQYTPTSSTTTTPPTSTTTRAGQGNIHYSLRFRKAGKHLPNSVRALVYCHSRTCNLKASGKLSIKGTKTKIRLGNAKGNFPYRKGRKPAGTLRFKIPAKGAAHIRKVLSRKDFGKLRVNVNSTATGPTGLTKKRLRNIKLFAPAQCTTNLGQGNCTNHGKD